MRIILLTMKDSPYSEYVTKKLIQNDQLHLVAIIESRTIWLDKGLFHSAIHLFRQASWYYLLSEVLKTWFFKIGTWLNFFNRKLAIDHPFYPSSRLIKEQKIPFYGSHNLNSEQERALIKSYAPDLLISVYLNQIVSQQTLDLAILGGINLHNSLLPSYRGLRGIFRAMLNREERIGVTIHKMDCGIDTGENIVQEIVPYEEDDSEHLIYCRFCHVTVRLLNELLVILDKKRNWPDLLDYYSPTIVQGLKESYYSLPKKDEIDRFFKASKCFHTFRHLLKGFSDTKRDATLEKMG